VTYLAHESLAPLGQALGSSAACRYLGLRAELVDGHVVVVLPSLDRHVGDSRRRSLHGGVLAAYLEAAAGAVLDVHRGDAGMATTISFTTAFVRPALVADTYALVEIVRVGRRIAHVRVDAWQTDTGATVTTGQGTFTSG
jgi:uncharacterized protein (TIGR00369 family)